ncbi:MAG TPA: molybdate ABC transporter permease subunit [Candidatus Didemnitutus sp.]|jgi:molybdate transport system permease protein
MTAADWQVTGFTLAVAAFSTILILPWGWGLAWLLARRDWPGKSLVETVVMLPLVMPPVATGLLLLKLLGRRGAIGGWLADHLGVDIVFTWRGVVAATAVMSFPLLVRTARVAFEGVNPRLEQVARTLGASPARVWWTVTMPLAGRGLLASGVIAFARAIGEFGATVMVAGFIPGKTATLALSIYNLVQLGHDDDALRLLGLSVLLAFAAVWAGERLQRRPAT